MVRSSAVTRIWNPDALKLYYEYDELTKNIRQYNVLIAGLAGQLKDDLAADKITSIEASIFDEPNFEYSEAEAKES
ncbi:MAG: hypothetical protein WBF90_02040 [Rivularia sp. (in: cyanobacteria)]|jgi:hypothetical protein